MHLWGLNGSPVLVKDRFSFEFIHLFRLTSVSVLSLDLSVIVVKGLQVFVAVHGRSREPHVHGSK